jgi:hypothetical protein
MQAKAKQPRLRISTILLSIVGAAIFVVGVNTSLLFGLVGSLIVAGAVTSYYEARLDRSRQVMLLLGVFVVCAGVAWAWLGWNETLKRSCIPEADCVARHQLNSLEQLDQQLFKYYDNWAVKSR